MITVDLLKNRPEHIPRLAAIWQKVLGSIWAPEVALDRVMERFKEHLNDASLPLTFVALENNIPVGMGSLRKNDGIREDLRPWLGSLVVAKEYQHQGVGKLLVQAVVEKAHMLGFNHLYLFAFDPTIPEYYKRLGWKKIGMDEFKSHLVTVMEIALCQEESFINLELVRQLIQEQFPEYVHLPITSVEKQGHDNRTYRLGEEMLIRLPTEECYALKVPKEQDLLPKLAKHLTISIPMSIKMGISTKDYPYPFSIYKWLNGISLNLVILSEKEQEQLAVDISLFLKSLQGIKDIDGPPPGQHNWWRGAHISVYDKGAREQISILENIIDSDKALCLWEKACNTHWKNQPVWVHGDMAVGNLLIEGGKLSGVIDFGGLALGDPACDLVIAWTYFKNKSRDIFMREMPFDEGTWLRARTWALWKATFELCQLGDKESYEALIQRKIIQEVLK